MIVCMDQWRSELDEVVRAGCESYGTEAVLGVLGEIAAELAAGSPAVAVLMPSVAVLGLSACDAGWVGVLVRPSGQTSLHVGGSLVGLVEQVRDQETLGGVGVQSGGRAAEVAAWLLTRPTVGVVEVEDADARAEALVAAGLAVPTMYSGMGFTEGELLVACAAVVEVARPFC